MNVISSTTDDASFAACDDHQGLRCNRLAANGGDCGACGSRGRFKMKTAPRSRDNLALPKTLRPLLSCSVSLLDSGNNFDALNTAAKLAASLTLTAELRSRITNMATLKTRDAIIAKTIEQLLKPSKGAFDKTKQVRYVLTETALQARRLIAVVVNVASVKCFTEPILAERVENSLKVNS